MQKISIFGIVAATVLAMTIVITEHRRSFPPDAPAQANSGRANQPVYMAGCQNFHGPVKPKKVHPKVQQNFVNRLCALEVFPPYGAILMQHQSPGLNY